MFTPKNSEKYDCFYALKPKNIAIDDFYKFYLTKDTLYGVKIAAEITEEADSVQQLGLLHYVLLPWIKRMLIKRKRLEAFYDYIDLESEQVLKVNNRNFKLPFKEINEVIFNQKENRRTYPTPNKGDIHIQLTNGLKLRFILFPAVQDTNYIQKVMVEKGLSIANVNEKQKNA